MNDQTVGLLAWYRNHAMPSGSDHCFSLEPEGDPETVAAQISDMHASGTTLSSDVEVVLLDRVFTEERLVLMNRLIALGDQGGHTNPIRELLENLMEKGAEIALRHQAAGR